MSDVSVGSVYYIPFWIVLEFLDAAPPDPFVKAEVINIHDMSALNDDTPIRVKCCDIIIGGKSGLIANNIPTEYLIKPIELPEWAERIANWFREFKQ